ncbi:aspartyl/glutamyl-tRNA amidotransferase subunit C [Candidatus Babeliales bacterium]|nr:aspartyl/glutamyl-tRNA amidotransferase subunit C [Candidatus Babeliales bacterium]
MAKITKEEILKIAQMTKVSFDEHEFDSIVQQFNDVLGYAERVVEIAKQAEAQRYKNINCDRVDTVVPFATEEILAQAPQSEDNYFVVPKFVDN